MKFAYPIVYVPDVAASLAFFEKAFGFTRRFPYESGAYGELNTGETTLAFAAHSLGATHLHEGYVEASSSLKSLGMDVAFVTTSVQEAHTRAVSAGAVELKAPESQLCGQIASYVRCLDGTLVQLCSPPG